MAYRVHAAGRSLAEPVHYDGRAETEALKARYAAWLKGKCSSDGAAYSSLSLRGEGSECVAVRDELQRVTYFN